MSGPFSLPLPDDWLPGEGPHLGAMVVNLQRGGPLERHIRPTEWRLLVDALADGGMEPGDLYVTSLIKAPGRDALLSEGLADISFAYLADEVQHTVPRFILALGQQVFTALTGSELELPLYRGIWQRLDERYDWDEALVLGTYAPADVLRYTAKMAPFRRDAAEFARAWSSKRTAA